MASSVASPFYVLGASTAAWSATTSSVMGFEQPVAVYEPTLDPVEQAKHAGKERRTASRWRVGGRSRRE